jgi:hypothetical protein
MVSEEKLGEVEVGVGVEVDIDLDMDNEGKVSIVAKRERNRLQPLDWDWTQLLNRKGGGNKIESHKELLGLGQRSENKNGYVYPPFILYSTSLFEIGDNTNTPLSSTDMNIN